MTHTHYTVAPRTATPAKTPPMDGLPLLDDADCCVVIDGHGRVTGCSEATGLMFGGSAAGLIGHRIWYLITNMTPSYTSPSFNARYIAAMSTDNHWRRFQAVDLHGQRFPVEISFAVGEEDEHDSFLIHLRHPVGAAVDDRFRPL